MSYIRTQREIEELVSDSRKRGEKKDMTQRYIYRPVGLDVWDRRPNQPEPGTVVVKTQPSGCPRNGTMGHCYVKDAVTGMFYGLVLVNSLEKEGR